MTGSLPASQFDSSQKSIMAFCIVPIPVFGKGEEQTLMTTV